MLGKELQRHTLPSCNYCTAATQSPFCGVRELASSLRGTLKKKYCQIAYIKMGKCIIFCMVFCELAADRKWLKILQFHSPLCTLKNKKSVYTQNITMFLRQRSTNCPLVCAIVPVTQTCCGTS